MAAPYEVWDYGPIGSDESDYLPEQPRVVLPPDFSAYADYTRQPWEYPGYAVPEIPTSQPLQWLPPQPVMSPEQLSALRFQQAKELGTIPTPPAAGGLMQGLLPLSKLAASPETWQAAMDVLSAYGGLPTPEARQEFLSRKTEAGVPTKVLSGVQESVLGGAEAMTSPVMLSTMGLAGASPVVARLAAAGWTAEMLRNAGPAGKELGEAFASEDPQRIAKATTDAAQLGFFAVGAGRHAVKGIGPTAQEFIRDRMIPPEPGFALPRSMRELQAQQEVAAPPAEERPEPSTLPMAPRAGETGAINFGQKLVGSKRNERIQDLEDALSAKQSLDSWNSESLVDEIAEFAYDLVERPVNTFRRKTGIHNAKSIEEGKIGLARMLKGEATEADQKAVQQFLDPTQEGIAENVADYIQDLPLHEASVITGHDLAKVAADELKGNIGGEHLDQILQEHGGALEQIAKSIRDSAKPQFNEAMMNHAKELTTLKKQRGLPIAPRAGEAGAISLHQFVALKDKLANAFGTRENKQIVSATRDAAETQSNVAADQISHGVELEAKKTFGDNSPQALDAVIAVIESGGDRTKLPGFIAQTVGRPGGKGARAAAEFADANWDAMQPLVDRFRSDTADQRLMEENAGIKVEERQNYFPHLFDVNKLPGQGAEFFPSQGQGGSGKFRAQRTFNTIYDAIEAGYGNAIKSLNAADVIQQRVKSGTQRVMDKAWVDSIRNLNDPTTSTPLVADVTIDPNGVMLAPAGYEVKTLFNGPPVAVHKGYGKFIDALTGGSQVAAFEVAGLPVGEAALKAEALIKHGTLLFDTFHASRMMQKASFLSPENFLKQLKNPKAFGKKGVSLLEYADRDLAEAVRQGEISPEISQWVQANRPDANLLIKRGLNVGQIQEALRSDIIKNVPFLGKYLSGFNGWVFQKVTRGALMEGGLIELERVQRDNPTWSREKVADKVAKDLNAYFGNLGRQGVFKSQTFQDLSRLALLAPNWFESMARSELYGYGQVGKAALSTATGQPKIGSIGKGMVNGMIAYMIGTQLLNLVTRGKPTWDNPEEGHKMDAFIPDVTGKSPGFFMSPMSVPAEITHDFFKYRSKKHDDSAGGAFQIAKNKMSPLSRALYTMATGDTYKGKVNGTWNRAKAAAISLVPVPIAASGFTSDRPGQVQRQLSSTLGFKIDPAETPAQQVRDAYSKWLADNPDPKVKADYERNLSATYPVSKYRDLDRALDTGDKEAAKKAIEEVRLEVSKDSDIRKRMQPFSGTGFNLHTKPLFHESAKLERDFRDSLNDKQRELYDKAIEDRLERWHRFLDVWHDRGDRPETP